MAKAKPMSLAIDTAHGHTERVMEAIKAIRRRLPKCKSSPATSLPTKPQKISSHSALMA